MKKYKWLYAVPAVIGVYLIYLQFKKTRPKPVKLDDVVVPPPNTNTNTGTPVYPLKNGSNNDTVKVLQGVLNMALPTPNPNMASSKKTIEKLVVDGDFGSKTEEALYVLTNKRQINSAAEFQAVIDIVKTKSVIVATTPPPYIPVPPIF